jgi:hypothetical protein
MTVPVNFDRGAARSDIRQTGNVIIFHLWSSFIESHSLLKVIKRHFVGCFSHYTAVLSPLRAVLSPFIYAVLLQLYAVVRALIRGAFNIIRDAFSHSTLFPHSFHDMYMI